MPIRPVGYGMIRVQRFYSRLRITRRYGEPNHTVSTRRVAFSRTFQAMNCLATIVLSLTGTIFSPDCRLIRPCPLSSGALPVL